MVEYEVIYALICIDIEKIFDPITSSDITSESILTSNTENSVCEMPQHNLTIKI